MKKMRKSTRHEFLASRLAAYSVMAGAAIALMPSAGAMIVPTDNNRMAETSGVGSHIGSRILAIESQQVRSQRVRHNHKHSDKMRVCDTSNCTSSTSSSSE